MYHLKNEKYNKCDNYDIHEFYDEYDLWSLEL